MPPSAEVTVRWREVRLRRNWPLQTPLGRRRYRLAASNALFSLARRWRWNCPAFIEHLRDVAERDERHHGLDHTAAPPEANVQITRVVFADIYLAEEFKQLIDGMERLYRRCGMRRFAFHGRTEWTRKMSSRTRGGSAHFGYFNLQALPHALRPWAFDQLQVRLTQLSPSVVAATFVAVPSVAFTSTFKALTSADEKQLTEIRRFNLSYGVTSAQIWSGHERRRDEIRRLFLSANAEITRILRSYVRAGLAELGPLPSLEVFRSDLPLQDIEAACNPIEASTAVLNNRLSPFLRTLRAAQLAYKRFVAPWYLIAPHEQDFDSTTTEVSYQLIASAPDHRRERSSRTTGGTDGDQLQASLQHVYDPIGPLIAIEAFYAQASAAALAIRNDLVPLLHGRGRMGTRRLRLSTAHRRIARANGLTFREARLAAEVLNRDSWAWFTFDVRDLVRRADARINVACASFAEVIKQTTTRQHAFFTEQMALIRPAYRDVLDYEGIEANDRLQRRVFWLTIVATLAAIMSVVPDDTRRKVLDAISALAN